MRVSYLNYGLQKNLLQKHFPSLISKRGHGNRNSLRIAVADTDLDVLDARLLGCDLGIAVQLYFH